MIRSHLADLMYLPEHHAVASVPREARFGRAGFRSIVGILRLGDRDMRPKYDVNALLRQPMRSNKVLPAARVLLLVRSSAMSGTVLSLLSGRSRRHHQGESKPISLLVALPLTPEHSLAV